jgi:hypothetical protein
VESLEAENAALRRLLAQSALPGGSQLVYLEQRTQQTWPEAALLETGRPTSATSSDVDHMLTSLPGSSVDRSVSSGVSGPSTPASAPIHAPYPSMGLSVPYEDHQSMPDHSSEAHQHHYSVLEDVDVVDWRYAWAQLSAHPLYPECDRVRFFYPRVNSLKDGQDALWQELRKLARYCVDRPPVIPSEQ